MSMTKEKFGITEVLYDDESLSRKCSWCGIKLGLHWGEVDNVLCPGQLKKEEKKYDCLVEIPNKDALFSLNRWIKGIGLSNLGVNMSSLNKVRGIMTVKLEPKDSDRKITYGTRSSYLSEDARTNFYYSWESFKDKYGVVQYTYHNPINQDFDRALII